MVHVVVGATNPNCREMLAKMFRQRHDVFITEKGWKLKGYNGLEFDQYDTAETIYLMQFDGRDNIIASMRMNPTDGPYMLADIFGEVCEVPIPRGRDVWELTRGALSKNLRKSGTWGRMQCAMLESALLWGATKATGGAETDRRACEEQKKRFMESQACFAKFRLANGGLRPEAFQHCTEVKQPRGC